MVDPTRDQFEIVEVDNIGIIEVPAEVFNQIEAGVTQLIQGLKSLGFSDNHLQELFELNGISEKGEVIIRNATSGSLKRIQLLNFQDSEVIIENDSQKQRQKDTLEEVRERE